MRAPAHQAEEAAGGDQAAEDDLPSVPAALPSEPDSTSEAEAKYGAKLDKMLGRFSGGR